MKKVLILGAGKSASVLILKLYEMSVRQEVIITIADLVITDYEKYNSEYFKTIQLNISDSEKLSDVIQDHDIVTSLMPPVMHFKVAGVCLEYGKHFLTASYLDERIAGLNPQITDKKLFFINEMGLDPGIDHLLAVEMIDEIRKEGGEIKSFESYCGGLVADESDTNPLHYKITWNPMNIVNAGKSGAKYLENGVIRHLNHKEVFEKSKRIEIKNAGIFEMYANRDSLSYIPMYNLNSLDTFIRGTLRIPNFCHIWLELINLNLTNESEEIDVEKLNKIIKGQVSPEVRWLLKDISLKENMNSVDFLYKAISEKLMFSDHDKDRVVLYHKIGYLRDKNLVFKDYLLDREGVNKQFTAMAETVGMPLLACIQLILENKITKYGILLPIDHEINGLVLNKLRLHGLLN